MSSDPQTRPRYVGLPTFMRLPYAEDWRGADIVIVGVPYDGGVTNRPGARHGPRAVRDLSSMIRKVNQATGAAPFDEATVVDGGDIWAERPFRLEDAHVEIEAGFRRLRESGAVPLAVGGDHSISLPAFRALFGGGPPVGMVHIDAHCDTGDDYLGSRFHHGAPFRRAVEEGLLDPGRTVQIGIRGSLFDPDMWRFSYESGMRVLPMEEVHEIGPKEVARIARETVGGGPAYLSFDIDSLDPAFAPGTGTPEVGGFSTAEALALLRGLAGVDFVAGDLVEVAPPFDSAGVTALAGANILFEMLCLFAGALARRRANGQARRP